MLLEIWNINQSFNSLWHKPSQLQIVVQLSKPTLRQPQLFELQPFLQEQLTNAKQDFAIGSRDISKGLRFPDSKVYPWLSGESTWVSFINAVFQMKAWQLLPLTCKNRVSWVGGSTSMDDFPFTNILSLASFTVTLAIAKQMAYKLFCPLSANFTVVHWIPNSL